MKKTLLMFLGIAIICILAPLTASAGLAAGVWDSEPGGELLPGGVALLTGTSSLDLAGSHPEYVGSTLEILSQEATPGTQWRIDAERVGGVLKNDWWEGPKGVAGSIYYMEMVGYYEGTGTFMFDGQQYTVGGYGVQHTYTLKMEFDGGDPFNPGDYTYIGMAGKGQASATGFIAPHFRIDAFGTYQETQQSGNHYEGEFDYTRMAISELPPDITGSDSDGDGVVDAKDQCPGTESPSCVDHTGCPCSDSVLFDINDDGKTGLAEAVYILETLTSVAQAEPVEGELIKAALVGTWDLGHDSDRQKYIHFFDNGDVIYETDGYPGACGMDCFEDSPLFVYGTYTFGCDSLTLQLDTAEDATGSLVHASDIDDCWVYSPYYSTFMFDGGFMETNADTGKTELWAGAGAVVTVAPARPLTCGENGGETTLDPLESDTKWGVKYSNDPSSLVLE